MATLTASTRSFVEGELTAADIDDVAMHLRATERALEHYCSGATKACVTSAIHLIDRAIQGETF